MKDYRLFDIPDFVMDEDFIRWVKERRKADNDFWNTWLQHNPEKHLAVSQARQIIEIIGTENKMVSEVDVQRETDKLLKTISREPALKKRYSPLRSMNGKWMYVAAAVIISIVLAAVRYIMPENNSSSQYSYTPLTSANGFVKQVNTSDQPMNLSLSDGSIIELAVKSSISFLKNFDTAVTRDVFLSGEAFFKVAKNPKRPFRVFANEIVAQVLGTSFIIRSFEKDSVIKVMVKTGKVGIYSQTLNTTKDAATHNQPGDIILTSNQQLVYEKAGQKFKKILLDNPVVINPAIQSSEIAYEDAPLQQVFDHLGKAYGINIIYDEDLLKKCTVTADLRNESFYHKLDLICSAIGGVYKISDGQVVIQSEGCQ